MRSMQTALYSNKCHYLNAEDWNSWKFEYVPGTDI